jgi:hypothetical protein
MLRNDIARFLAPDRVKAAVEGRLPRGIGVARLRDARKVKKFV